MLNKKYILLFTLFIVFLNSLVFAQNFIGPSCQPGQCQGRIGVDSNGNISVGTSTPQSNTRLYLVGSTVDSSAYGLRIMNSNLGPILWVRNDGRVSIGTTTANYALNVSGDIYTSGNLIMAGNLSAPISSGNVTPGVFNSLQGGGTGAYAFLGSLGIATSSNAGLPQTLSVYGGGYFSGDLGIGVIPGTKLHIRGSQGNLAINTESVTNSIVIEAFNDGNTVKRPIFLNPWGGGVGIGTTTISSYNLNVVGQINASGGLCISGDCKTSWSQVGGGGQWITTSTGIYYSGGNVGIGTVSPEHPLDVVGLIRSQNSGVSAVVNANASGIGYYGTISNHPLGFIINNTEFVRINSSGYVGIGTNNPIARLTIQNNSGGINDFISIRRGSTDWRIWASDSVTASPSLRIGGSSAGTYAWQFDWSGSSANIFKSPNNVATQRVVEILGAASQSGDYLSITSSGGSAGNVFVVKGTGNVGIATTTPNARLQISGRSNPADANLVLSNDNNTYNVIRFQHPAGTNIGSVHSFGPGWTASGAWLPNTIVLEGRNVSLFASDSNGVVRFYSGGTNERMRIESNGTVTIGNGNGKINVGTIDPPYTINGKKYATYVPAMTGQKEETTGILKIKNSNCQNNICKYDIDFSNQEEGSDLWLFSKITNLKNNFSKMTVLLTSNSKAKVWYNKNNNLILSIYLEPQEQKEEYEVSYRLTASRFDAEKLPNKRNDNDSLEPEGLIIED